MARAKRHEEHVNHERWLISYADFITLLFAFFVVMFAVSKVDAQKAGRFQDSFLFAAGVTSNERGYLPRPEDLAEPINAMVLPDQKAAPTPIEDAGKEFPDELAKLQSALEAQRWIDEDLAKLKIIRRGNDLVLRLDATFLFGSGDDSVQADSLDALQAIAEQVRGHKVQVRVEGHTDDQPIKTLRYRSNWDLSTARATSVVEQLTSRALIDSRRIAAMGHAEFQPLVPNDSNENRAKNRRVDIVLSIEMPLADEEPASQQALGPPSAPATQ